jgi:hypothetical protein
MAKLCFVKWWPETGFLEETRFLLLVASLFIYKWTLKDRWDYSLRITRFLCLWREGEPAGLAANQALSKR